MSKKTESIEVRLSPELKESLNALGAERGEAMSAIVRSLVEQEVQRDVKQESSGSAPFSHSRKGHTSMPNFFRSPRKAFTSSAVALSMLIALGLGLNTMTINVATAQEDFAALFKEADQNKDGSVDAAEFTAFFNSDIGAIEDDMAHDDMLMEFDLPEACAKDEDAFAAFDADINPDQEITEFFAEIDRDKNGKVDLEEMLTSLKDSAQEEFNKLDADKNGEIKLSEFLTLAQTDPFAASIAKDISAECLQAAIALDEQLLAEEFAEIDVNGDSVLSLEEFQNPV